MGGKVFLPIFVSPVRSITAAVVTIWSYTFVTFFFEISDFRGEQIFLGFME